MKPLFSLLAVAVLAGVVVCCALILGSSAPTQIGSQRPHIESYSVPTYEHPKPPGPNEPKPRVKVDEDVYDFGLMDVMTEGQHQFIIRNVGEGPLVLKQGETTCSCTISTIQSDGVVPPGGEASVKLSWETKSGGVEDYRQTAEILTNDALNPTIKLVVKGTVRSFLVMLPPVWIIPKASPSEPTKQTVILASPSLHPFEITKIESSIPEDLTYDAPRPASKESLKRMQELSGYKDMKYAWEVDVTLGTGMPSGRFFESMKFYTNIEKKDKDGNTVVLPPQHLRVEGLITGDIDFFGRDFERARRVLMLANVPSATGKTGKLFMYTGGAKQDIHPRVKSTDPDFLQVSITKAEEGQGAAYEVQITVPAGTLPCNYMGIADEQGRPRIGRVLLETDDAVEKELLLLVQFAVEQVSTH